jgi:hypothetical protein
MDAAIATRKNDASNDGPLSPSGKRSVELKRRSIEPAEFVSPTSAPKLLCTFSAKLVDVMSNFSIVDGEGLEIEGEPSGCSGGSDGAAATAANVDGGAGAGAEEAMMMRDGGNGCDDTSSAISERGTALCSVPEHPAGLTDDEASGPTAKSDDDETGAVALPGLQPAAAAALAALPASHGLAAVFDRFAARSVPSAAPADVAAAVRSHLKAHAAACMDTLYVYDLAQVARMHAAWVAAMPRVQPYYAVKCNPEPALLAVLEALGCGFDCASQQELSQVVLRMGVDAGRVIFANPCKRPADIAMARKLGVERTTFDTECELLKIAAAYPSASCVLRLRCDDAGAQVRKVGWSVDVVAAGVAGLQ